MVSRHVRVGSVGSIYPYFSSDGDGYGEVLESGDFGGSAERARRCQLHRCCGVATEWNAGKWFWLCSQSVDGMDGCALG